ncbi:MAG: uncharacterized protein KVP18_002513 [Porospora cf. gigantea A]|uniref:uncharacterized protein n=1 Tax=Porospora cf. gigantea A TaxID=2853593 RepID=UPI003559F03B|nr:MAG: hypothetical protein KVP18_002513 [Porospora cf. gigantea A]
MWEGRISLLCLELDWELWPAIVELGLKAADLQPVVSSAMVDFQPAMQPTERTLTERNAAGHAHGRVV